MTNTIAGTYTTLVTLAAAIDTMRFLAKHGIVAGESGAAGLAALRLALTDDDVEWIKKYGSQPKAGSWERWIRAAFERHIDLVVRDRPARSAAPAAGPTTTAR